MKQLILKVVLKSFNHYMKDTHTFQDLENLMYEYAVKIRDARTKTEKKELLKELRGYEKQWNNVSDKNINGKKYPVKKQPKDIPKKELLALIDEVRSDPTETSPYYSYPAERWDKNHLDVSGVSVGSNRFTFKE